MSLNDRPKSLIIEILNNYVFFCILWEKGPQTPIDDISKCFVKILSHNIQRTFNPISGEMCARNYSVPVNDNFVWL